MNLNQVKNYTKGVLQGWFLNKPALDKISESDDGKILYNNKELDVTEQVASIKKYQKYLNTELDYCYLQIPDEITTSEKIVIPFNKKIEGKMDINIENCSVLLKAGKTYQISTDIGMFGKRIVAHIYDITNDKIIFQLQKAGGTYTGDANDTQATCIYAPQNDCEVQVKIDVIDNSVRILPSRSYFIVQEINRQIVIDPVEHVNESQGIEDTPVGHIIAHMGTVAPKHYLICDGSEYNISDYPYLAQHMIDNFGSVNHFGGDGTTTFTVPDLRGEFLRGTGENSYENQGSGSEVGKHQDATYRFTGGENITSDSTIFGVYINKDKGISGNHDSTFSETGRYANYSAVSTGEYTAPYYTARPTNTSVLYCIKYEPTYFMVKNNTNYLQPTLYSEEEKCIGSWINGKPLYKKTIITTLPTVSTNGTLVEEVEDIGIENIDIATNLEGFIIKGNASLPINASTKNPPNTDTFSCIFYREATLVKRSSVPGWNNCPVYITLQYTKTTDAENSFNQNMITDFIIQGSEEVLTQEQIQTAIDEDAF